MEQPVQESISPVKQMASDMIGFFKSIFTPFGATMFCLVLGIYFLSLTICAFSAWRLILTILSFITFGLGVYLTWFRGSSNDFD